MAEKKDNVTSKFKDNVFCMLYRDKKNLLELYNALNNSAYTNVDDLQVTTLNGGSYMKYKNDASFLLCMILICRQDICTMYQMYSGRCSVIPCFTGEV